MARYADIIVNRHHQRVDQIYTYRVPEELRGLIQPGMMAEVPFGTGSRKIRGYVIAASDQSEFPETKMKTVLRLLGEEPVFSRENLDLAAYIKTRYGATLSSCLALFVPKNPQVKMTEKKKSILPEATEPHRLNEEQQAAKEEIMAAIRDGRYQGFLLHGITGSGKTEIYMHCIEEARQRGRQTILLVPEISLTPQLIHVLQARFGDRVGILHSRLSDGERSKRWRLAREGRYDVMIGPRSALFTPFSDLGLVILDEEHEASYKSEEMPAYHAREVAEELCRRKDCPMVLGSATPSVETFYRTQQGELTLLTLTRRATGMTLPEVEIADLRSEVAEGNMGLFSNRLAEAMRERLERGEQTILFLNRKGYATFVSCRSCGFVLRCPKCYLPYTYHQDKKRLICHHCGKTAAMPSVCPDCGSPYIRSFGVGTQRVEEEAARLFPNARVSRMDLGTAGRTDAHEEMYRKMHAGEIDILVGTQMVAKGFDFPKVTLVGIIAADMTLYGPDYHSTERTFQLLTQAAGRAGRSERLGEVILQTFSPEHYCIGDAARQDYQSFYQNEITAREIMGYPPFVHMLQILITGRDEEKVRADAAGLHQILNYYGRGRDFVLLGPAPASLGRINDQFRWKILIKHAEWDRLLSYGRYCIDIFMKEEPVSLITMEMDPVQMQ